MHSAILWKLAPRPNYIDNVDLQYPYSEVPHLGEYHLVKIPHSFDEFIDHVDYWGEGLIVTDQGISGFSNCYNVNHTYQLVSNGPDKDKKIPNRIPVSEYNKFDTRSYIRANSVFTVTLMGAPINESCAKDITRIINKDYGKVIVYGFSTDSPDIKRLTAELKKKSLFHFPNYKVSDNFQGLTLFDSTMVFMNNGTIKPELYRLVNEGVYDDAVTLTKVLYSHGKTVTIGETVNKLLEANSTANTKLMSYAYKLWNSGASDIVKNPIFPKCFQYIFNKSNVTIVNVGYLQALKLDENIDQNMERRILGGTNDKSSDKIIWQLQPVWENNDVTFKLYNIDHDMYLKLADNADYMGDRPAYGSKNLSDDGFRYYLEPFMKLGVLTFFIINYHYRQGLKLGASVSSTGDRSLWGHNGDIYNGEDRFKWVISNFTSAS